MPETNDYYAQLLADYINNTCTPKQVDELMQWLQQDASNRVLLQQLQTEFRKAMEENAEAPAEISNRVRVRLMQSIRPPLYKRLFFRAAAAAILILMLGAGWFFFGRKEPVKEAANKSSVHPTEQTTITKKTGAFITLANGEQIELGKTENGSVIDRDHNNIIKLADSRIAYDTAANNNAEVTYHTLTVPRGIKMVQVMLADGSLVWLNTASSLKYPTSFTGHERSVELTGEAYFEVKHDAGRPFAVRTKNMTVDVLGTGFNVSAYEDDEQSNVVLVKGSVAISAKGKSGMLQKQLVPGNMASFQTGAGNISVATVNTDEYVSWKNGYLIFRQAPLEQIVKRISRYYDVHINTNDLAKSDETFSGRLDLQNSIEDVMNLVCLGTSYIYLPKEHKLALKK
jgi:ferric-dicitrate binding protein FerR (iron transport regulator)